MRSCPSFDVFSSYSCFSLNSSLFLNSFSSSRNLSTQEKRVLKDAANNGIVEERSGKFRINADLLDPYKHCAECRRRKKTGKKTRRRRRHQKEHSVASGADSERYTESVGSDDTVELPVKQLRRRRKKGKRRRTAEDKEKDVIELWNAEQSEHRRANERERLCNVKQDLETMSDTEHHP